MSAGCGGPLLMLVNLYRYIFELNPFFPSGTMRYQTERGKLVKSGKNGLRWPRCEPRYG